MSLVEFSANFIEYDCKILHLKYLNITEHNRLARWITCESAFVRVIIFSMPFHIIIHHVHDIVFFLKLKSFLFEKSFNNSNLIILQILNAVHLTRASCSDVLQVNKIEISILKWLGYISMLCKIVVDSILLSLIHI